jgi:uncharacterized protein
MARPKQGETIERRLARADWAKVRAELDEQGWSHLPAVLNAAECRRLVDVYTRESLYRSTVDMERYRFGRGQYRYFAYPLPPLIESLRQSLYVRLQPVANLWTQHWRRDTRYPSTLDAFLAHCHSAGQTRPTPLLLRYGAGDYNCLHQDVYGAIGFPLQALVLLSQHNRDYAGGEVIFVEQRPRAQSKATAIMPERGDAVVFTNRDRPVRGSRGFYSAQMRHGASVVRRGQRFVLGVIFHDAR